ncbi:hypothetical protein [Fluviicola sp.]|uniref:hypothetical protein n=1 Tax=Fluviicola sp. TaxID=1917219 RepID=UPI00262C20E7|nr:hypothetical protein [Fluviicola sp.]
MKLITLWSIIIKIIGVYFAVSFVQITALLLAGFASLNLLKSPEVLVSVLIHGAITFLCLFRTEKIIQVFKLERSIEEKEFQQVTFSNAVGLAIVIIGIYTLSEGIPEFLGTVFNRQSNFPACVLVFSKVVLGLLMVLKTKELEQLIHKYKK